MPTITDVNDTVSTTSDWTITLTGDSTVTYLWDVDGTTYTGSVINPSFTSNGTVTVTLTASNDCGSIDTTLTLDVTQIGVEELALDVANIYPNPSSGSFNVEFTSSENLDYRIELMDAMGRLVSFKEGRTSNVTEVRFDTDLPAGVYIVKTMVGEQMNIDRVTIRR
jgi:PKD repeat protein